MFSKEKARQLADKALGVKPQTALSKKFPDGIIILTSRPDWMSIEEYKRLRKQQQKAIHKCLR